MNRVLIGCIVVVTLLAAGFLGWTQIKASLPKSACTHDCCDNHSCTAAEREALKKKAQ